MRGKTVTIQYGQTRRKVNPDTVIKYAKDTKDSVTEIASHFKISSATVHNYIKEKCPELKEQLGHKVNPKDVIQYVLETGAPYEKTGKHFGICKVTVSNYIKKEIATNPEFEEQLIQARQKFMQKVIQYRIDTRETYEEIGNHFGITSRTVAKYIGKETNPEVIGQLNAITRKPRKKRTSEITKLREEKSQLKEENTRLKARIALLEQELKDLKSTRQETEGPKSDLQSTRQEVQEQIQEQSVHHESELDVLLRVYDKGKMTEHDAEVLLQFHRKLEEIQRKQARNSKWRNELNYSTMISTLRAMLATKSSRYHEQRLPELKKFISTEYYGPLYEIENDTTIGKLASKIQMLSGTSVSSIELVMIINRLNTEGKSHEISGKINTEAISNVRSKIEECYEKIQQEGLLLTGEGR